MPSPMPSTVPSTMPSPMPSTMPSPMPSTMPSPMPSTMPSPMPSSTLHPPPPQLFALQFSHVLPLPWLIRVGLVASVVDGQRVIWLPTGCLRLLEAMYTARPNATVIAADFSVLPDVQIPGANAPLVAAKPTTPAPFRFNSLDSANISISSRSVRHFPPPPLAANAMAAEYPPPESNPSTNYAPPPAYPPTGANPPPSAGYDVEAGGGAGKPPAATGGSTGSSRMSTFIGIGLRIAELLLCMISFHQKYGRVPARSDALPSSSSPSLSTPFLFSPPFPFLQRFARSLLVSTKYDYTKLSAGAFLLAMTIIGFILAFFLLVLLVASLFVSALRPFQGKLRLFQVVECWLLSLLLFAAACTAGAQASSCVNTEGGSYFGYYIPDNNDCGLVKGSVAMAFLASFAYIGGFWYYALVSYHRR
ncbi:unnamed protein product [Closterium sp. Yama58-4]|nr:unnamed protein product [Closterium sp. Yama58-4]